MAKKKQFCFSARLCELFLVSVHMVSFHLLSFSLTFRLLPFFFFFPSEAKKNKGEKKKKTDSGLLKSPANLFKIRKQNKTLNSGTGQLLTSQQLICSQVMSRHQAVCIKSSYAQMQGYQCTYLPDIEHLCLRLKAEHGQKRKHQNSSLQ